MTNRCNRACPWCSTCSSPSGGSFLSIEQLEASFPGGDFELQLEGGEPTVHPKFLDMVALARRTPRCRRVVIVTNGARLPRRAENLARWLESLGAPLTIKLSINHYLLAHDLGLMGLAVLLRDLIEVRSGVELVLNVRLRPKQDKAVSLAVEEAGLLPWANVFHLQRYGFASEHTDWEEPFVVGLDFTLLNPDGSTSGTDLIERSRDHAEATVSEFVEQWRRLKSRAFDLKANSTAGRTLRFSLWGAPVEVYANANFSIYSAQTCNAKCPFCVEELRPASRGRALQVQRGVERSDSVYFDALDSSLEALRPLEPTISITGGEPSKDPRLPEILRIQAPYASPRRTLTTNASGLMDSHESKRLIDHILEAGLDHLNISRAAPEHHRNAKLMVLPDALGQNDMKTVVDLCNQQGTRVRLSCVLLKGVTDSLADVARYLDFAKSIGVDNVIFRQLMHIDERKVLRNYVVQYSEKRRALLEPILDEISEDPRFTFQRQIVGYYYYVEVWRYDGIDVVFEEADLGQLEESKRTMPGIIHELIFHPNAQLCSTWQPWDGQLGPPLALARTAV